MKVCCWFKKYRLQMFQIFPTICDRIEKTSKKQAHQYVLSFHSNTGNFPFVSYQQLTTTINKKAIGRGHCQLKISIRVPITFENVQNACDTIANHNSPLKKGIIALATASTLKKDKPFTTISWALSLLVLKLSQKWSSVLKH